MNRHYGMKIALVCIRQVLVNILEVEIQQFIDFHIEVMKKGLEFENEEEWELRLEKNV